MLKTLQLHLLDIFYYYGKFYSEVLVYDIDISNQEITKKAANVGLSFLSYLFESIFLCLWGVINYGVNKVANYIEPTNIIDKWQIVILQVVFAMSTLFPIAIQVYTDVRIQLINSSSEVLKAKRNAR